MGKRCDVVRAECTLNAGRSNDKATGFKVLYRVVARMSKVSCRAPACRSVGLRQRKRVGEVTVPGSW